MLSPAQAMLSRSGLFQDHLQNCLHNLSSEQGRFLSEAQAALVQISSDAAQMVSAHVQARVNILAAAQSHVGYCMGDDNRKL